MISAGGKIVLRRSHNVEKRLAIVSASNTYFASFSSSSSSVSSLSSLVPESIREAVKSTVLDEASRNDSKLWADPSLGEDTTPRKPASGTPSRPKLNGGSSHVVWKETASESYINDNNSGNEFESINDAISISRRPSSSILLHDPLDEWHLQNRRPLKQQQQEEEGVNTNNNDSSSCPGRLTLPKNIVSMEEGANPFDLAREDMTTLSEGIRNDLIASDHPVLNRAAAYFFEVGQDGGKKVRPMMVLLLSRAMMTMNPHHQQTQQQQQQQQQQRLDLPAAQRRLAEISEMIHTASLFHDDVIDDANTRRGSPAVHRVFGNKMAILAGDYLLARSSICLARLRNVEVVETMSTIIEHLVRGEVMQMKGNNNSSSSGNSNGDNSKNKSEDVVDERMLYYLRKNFYKTSSLMANSCKSAALLGGYDDTIVEAAYRYGKHVGIAFQLVDDVLDYTGNEVEMGKPALSDLQAGLATGPVLFAAEMFPELDAMIGRKFGHDGDVEKAEELVRLSDGIERTMELASIHAQLAMDAVMTLQPSLYRDSLVHLAYKVVDRSH